MGQVLVPGVSIVIVSWCPALFSPSSSGNATPGMTTWKQSVRGNSGREEEPRRGGWGPSREEAIL